MIQATTISTTEVSFKDFLFRNKRNRTILWLTAAAIAIQFAIFKYLYPFASFIHGDSFSYINAAYANASINNYLIGYSKFLRLLSVFSKSDFILVGIQYLFIQTSIFYLLFSLFYFYSPCKPVQFILLLFMAFNPLSLHLANLVSSDGLFLALSMTWITLLLWIINKPSNKIIIWHTLILGTAFTVRYNAIIYPIISLIALLLSNLSVKQKVASITAGIAICTLFIIYTSYNYSKLTGTWQYSPFSGWQLANNAMYAYRYVPSSERKDIPIQYRQLDNMIRAYFDSTRNTNKFPLEKIQASTYYMWSKSLTLFKYSDIIYKKDSTITDFKKWALMGPFFKSYGLHIIMKYPKQFLYYFVWPNANKYYAPPTEFLSSFNSGSNYVTPQVKNWFGYSTTRINTRMIEKDTWVLNFYPILSGIINITMLCSLICYFLLKGWQMNRIYSKGVLISSLLWILNAVFTISASSAALRFQSFPILTTVIFSFLLLDWLVSLITNIKVDKNQLKVNSGEVQAIIAN